MATNTNCNEIVFDSYQYSCTEHLSWTENMKAMLSEIGLMEVFFTKNPDAHLETFQRLTDIYIQATLEKIKNEECKLRTFALFKTTPGFEKYLDEITNIKERTALTKFRLSNSVLMIEKGRNLYIDMSLRFCPSLLHRQSRGRKTLSIRMPNL